MNIQRSDNYFVISFKYQPYLVEAVKSLPGKRWDGTNKVWLVPTQYKSDVTSFANRYGFQFSSKGYSTDIDAVYELQALPELTTELNLAPGIVPYPYQKQGIQRGLDLKRFLNGDKPGLGKSETLNSLISTPKGWVKMGDIQVGDSIFAKDGSIQTVEGIFPQGVISTYRVTMNDGTLS